MNQTRNHNNNNVIYTTSATELQMYVQKEITSEMNQVVQQVYTPKRSMPRNRSTVDCKYFVRKKLSYLFFVGGATHKN